jgi:hypothetical protein
MRGRAGVCGQEEGSHFRAVVEEEVQEGLLADVDGKEFAEEGWPGGEGMKGSIAEPRMTIEKEQEGRHALWEGEDRRVVRFVQGEAACREGIGEEDAVPAAADDSRSAHDYCAHWDFARFECALGGAESFLHPEFVGGDRWLLVVSCWHGVAQG